MIEKKNEKGFRPRGTKKSEWEHHRSRGTWRQDDFGSGLTDRVWDYYGVGWHRFLFLSHSRVLEIVIWLAGTKTAGQESIETRKANLSLEVTGCERL